MTILNVYVSEDEKKKIKDIVSRNEIKSISEFVREAVNERIIIDAEENKLKSDELGIPDYIPENKYVLFNSDKIIAAVGNSPQDVASQAAKKGIDPPFIIKFNGENPKVPHEYFYNALGTGKAWQYGEYLDKSYPILKTFFKSGKIEDNLYATIDTSASLCILKESKYSQEKLDLLESGIEISTAGGKVKKPIYQATVTILDTSFDIKFITAPIDDFFPFEFFIGRNLLDRLDAYFFGKKQIFLLKLAQ